ncbi:hypothetical protein SRABI106_01779 [Rahnella aquatilis]|nr:hypothetical protein SRABI106_01779 [Rahnella aquatilis]
MAVKLFRSNCAGYSSTFTKRKPCQVKCGCQVSAPLPLSTYSVRCRAERRLSRYTLPSASSTSKWRNTTLSPALPLTVNSTQPLRFWPKSMTVSPCGVVSSATGLISPIFLTLLLPCATSVDFSCIARLTGRHPFSAKPFTHQPGISLRAS